MILNLTQHPATPEQIAAGVVELDAEIASDIRRWMTAETLDSLRDDLDPEEGEELGEYEGSPGLRAHMIALLASDEAERLGATHAMIGGAPWLMAPLEACLRQHGIRPVYAFSRRESVEQRQADGSVRKINLFHHGGWIPAADPGPYLEASDDKTTGTLGLSSNLPG